METTLATLIQKRKNYIHASNENSFTDGIHSLLTNLYPDKAHFIFELLQNAEDMNATVVRFTLYEDGIDFEHNGTKRSFNIADIDAITNIGHNAQKKDDPTSIGKFGIGFKAVFAYTTTPIIHSGKYHFKIRDYFLPDFDDIDHIVTQDKDGVEWTKFSFPFNHKVKTPQECYSECYKGLRQLDSSSVIFLQNISKIEYMFSNGELGVVERQVINDNLICTKTEFSSQRSEIQEWLRFSKYIDIKDEQENLKHLPVSIAFAIGQNEKTKQKTIIPIQDGKVFIYFPAEKEYSGLRFHINAPFASTVGRDSVRNCKENTILMKEIAQLLVDSLPEIKAKGFMNHGLFRALPNYSDRLNWSYGIIFDYIYSAFKKGNFIPAKNGDYISASKALMGSNQIHNIIEEKDLFYLTGKQKQWIVMPMTNSLEDKFLNSLNIEKFDYKEFRDLFNNQYRCSWEQMIQAKKTNKKWLKAFYLLCETAYDRANREEKVAYQKDMCQTCFIQATNKILYKPADIFVLPRGEKAIENNMPIVDLSPFQLKEHDKWPQLLRLLHIKEYGPKAIITEKLKKYKNHQWYLNQEYFNDILLFANYLEKNPLTSYPLSSNYIDFSQYKLFLNMEKKACCANELFFGRGYGEGKVWETLAQIYNKNLLWNDYIKYYTKQNLEKFKKFAISCGIWVSFPIIKQEAIENPLFYAKLSSYASRDTGKGDNIDYTIPRLEEILQLKLPSISKKIWETLEKEGKHDRFSYYSREKRFWEARYAPNASATIKTCSSSLILLLQEYEWVIGKDGKMYKPKDVTLDMLSKQFSYDKNNDLLRALKIGETQNEILRKEENAKRAAEEAGGIYLDKDERKDYEEFKRQKRKQIQNKTSQEKNDSVKDLFHKQQREEKNEGNDHINDSNGVVSASDRQGEVIAQNLLNASKMSYHVREMVSRIKDSNKQEKNILRKWYDGKCQICGTTIIDAKQDSRFWAINVINTKDLPEQLNNTIKIGWNSLSLCPNCATKYKYCELDLSTFYDQIIENEVVEDDETKITIEIEMENKPQTIHYVPEHFFRLKKMIELIDQMNKEG